MSEPGFGLRDTGTLNAGRRVHADRRAAGVLGRAHALVSG